VYAAHRDEQFRVGVAALNRALSTYQSRRRGFRTTRGERAVANAIKSLPKERYRDFINQRRLLRSKVRSADETAIDAAIAFVLRQFQYRYVNVFDFLSGYAAGSPRKIDLAVCHLIDFDWPLAGGRPTMTSISEQIDVMEQITILTGGRIHCYAPFDPMKQVAYRLGYTSQSLGAGAKRDQLTGIHRREDVSPNGVCPDGECVEKPKSLAQALAATRIAAAGFRTAPGSRAVGALYVVHSKQRADHCAYVCVRRPIRRFRSFDRRALLETGAR